MGSEFITVCPKCRSPNIKQMLPQMTGSWMCFTCGNRDFYPVEIMRKEIK